MLDELYNLVKDCTEGSNQKIFELIKDADLYGLVWPNGETLLHWASAFNNTDIIEHILENDLIHVNISNYRGTTSLIYACSKDNTDAIVKLLSYNANPYIKSGFTGLRPSETCELEENKILLEEYVNKYVPLENLRVKEGFNLYQSYSYREYMWYLSNLDYYTSKFKHIIHGFTPNTNAKYFYDTGGPIMLSNRLDSLLESYYDLINNPESIIEKSCLACGETNDTKRCSKCKQVYFCNKICQKFAHPIHKYDCECKN